MFWSCAMCDVTGWPKAPEMAIFGLFLAYYEGKIAVMHPLVLIFVTFV